LTDPHTSDGSGTGHFTSTITGLTVGITYYVRAYATTAGTVYGNQELFVPAVANLPTVTTNAMSNLVGAIAEGGGTVVSDGGNPVSAYGICWGLSANPSLTSNLGFTNDGTGVATYFSTLTGLSIGTTYHVRAYATNVGGTSYGSDISFIGTAATIGQVITPGSIAIFGGNVFYISGAGLHGLITDPYGFNADDWGCASAVTGATGTAIGTGAANTTAIRASNTTNSCVTTSGWGVFACDISILYDGPDWYLPSKDEFNMLWTNQVAAGVDVNLSAAGGTAPFWCSSELTATTVWSFDATLPTPAWVTTGLKTDLINVWPIRSF
jgi:hypothetical protein